MRYVLAFVMVFCAVAPARGWFVRHEFPAAALNAGLLVYAMAIVRRPDNG